MRRENSVKVCMKERGFTYSTHSKRGKTRKQCGLVSTDVKRSVKDRAVAALKRDEFSVYSSWIINSQDVLGATEIEECIEKQWMERGGGKERRGGKGSSYGNTSQVKYHPPHHF